ncbi:DNA methylase N-4/N-6 domain-containing protein [Methanocaldococcus bathoardescens]|uniref:DNA methylase N-4/N-6 domain-containing protein n=1 Tax=Methanocaldococcus bathoardescens TaxID=1301915 RepID=A0A076LBC8_9EURY|nr:site-specific DNA-methyltransferase [Methanocaldococcus bathoardescens]AIJ05476.1 DNA methylase N-4/N-6 domain-containing protein [Methanocaldococcus bathoardescens]
MENSQEKFFNVLKDVFIGAKVEGESGYINLMRIKSKYFDKIFKELQKDINEKTKEFPEFREELFNKLYSFFKRYFSESGSIYFRWTPFNERIYERVYTDNKDVVMFWKTHMLYYVKTDIILKSMNIEIDGKKFFFDVSKLEHKKANEKRQLIYELKEVSEDGTIVFNVLYSEKGRKTKINDILKQLKKAGIILDEEILEKAFRIFEKQNEVDYFINKNAKQFLKEQFDLWLYQYVYSDETQFTEKRIKQLKVLKDMAYKIINFISQFEDELVKIWQKPKFVLNSNYVITLDRIAEKDGGIEVIEKIVERLIEQKNSFEKDLANLKEIKQNKKSYRERFEEVDINNQLVEWYLLDLIDENFNPKEILINGIVEKKVLNPKYKFLPIDTKYFDEEIKFKILELFDDLDNELDGWLIKSENYQALNTILPKFKEKIQTIYIDPPFNTGSNEFTMYINRFLDSAWITMMENRLRLAKEFLKETGSIFVRIDYHGNHYVRFLMDDIFGKENFRNEILVNRTLKAFEGANRFIVANDSLFYYSKSDKSQLNPVKKPRREQKWIPMHSPGVRWSKVPKQYLKYYSPDQLIEKNGEFYSQGRVFNGKVYMPPPGRHWTFTQDRLDEYAKEGRIRVNPKTGMLEYLTSAEQTVDSNWLDIPGYVVPSRWDFPTENSEQLLKRVILSTSNENDIVLDFFLGSGTTTAVAHKLKRKWIGVEMSNHFYTVILPRMKKVLAYDKSGISKDEDVKENYNKDKAGGFFKYYELEQYEDTLRKVKYVDAEPFFDPTQDIYNQYIFMKDLKLLEALEIDYKNNKVKVNLEKLYKNIDIAETLSNLLGKRIKKITRDFVEFEDGEKVDSKNLDYRLIKPLIWW